MRKSGNPESNAFKDLVSFTLTHISIKKQVIQICNFFVTFCAFLTLQAMYLI